MAIGAVYGPVVADVVSDRFELQWELDGTDLLLAIGTDLPDTAEVIVSVGRVYFEVGNDRAYSRDYLREQDLISRWRKPRRIPIDDEAWKSELIAHQSEMASISRDLAFEIARIEDQVQVRAVIHRNQPDPRFGGPGNPSLSGAAVSESRNIIKAETSIPLPLAGTPPAGRSGRIAYDGLREGESYRLQDLTPLLPLRNLEGLSVEERLEAMRRILELPAGQVVRVIGVDYAEGVNPWYEVGKHQKVWGNQAARGSVSPELSPAFSPGYHCSSASSPSMRLAVL